MLSIAQRGRDPRVKDGPFNHTVHFSSVPAFCVKNLKQPLVIHATTFTALYYFSHLTYSRPPCFFTVLRERFEVAIRFEIQFAGPRRMQDVLHNSPWRTLLHFLCAQLLPLHRTVVPSISTEALALLPVLSWIGLGRRHRIAWAGRR